MIVMESCLGYRDIRTSRAQCLLFSAISMDFASRDYLGTNILGER